MARPIRASHLPKDTAAKGPRGLRYLAWWEPYPAIGRDRGAAIVLLTRRQLTEPALGAPSSAPNELAR